jgi:hypothetical protein
MIEVYRGYTGVPYYRSPFYYPQTVKTTGK